MKKSTLLGGAARIVREPSHQEMQLAMLRRLGAGHIVDMEMPVRETAARAHAPAKPKEKSEFDIALERETGWIEEQLHQDIAALGAGPEILRIAPDQWHGWTVTMLQWRPNGIGAEVDHVVRLERTNYRDPFTEAKLRKAIRNRFAKTLATQAAQVRELGPPRLLGPDEIDLSRFRIDKPLAAALDQFYPDAGALMRKALAEGNSDAFHPDLYNREKLRADLSFGRDTVRGEFAIISSGITLSWSKGGLSVFGAPIPETIMMGCAGHPLGSLIDHHMFDGTMKITAVHPTRHAGENGYALTLRDTTCPMPAHW